MLRSAGLPCCRAVAQGEARLQAQWQHCQRGLECACAAGALSRCACLSCQAGAMCYVLCYLV